MDYEIGVKNEWEKEKEGEGQREKNRKREKEGDTEREREREMDIEGFTKAILNDISSKWMFLTCKRDSSGSRDLLSPPIMILKKIKIKYNY